MSDEKLNECNYPDEKWFIAQITEDGIWLRTPNDIMLKICEDADLKVNASRAVFMAEACNNALRAARFNTLF